MFKIALINPPYANKYSQPPMGLALIAAVLERAGYQVTMVDANALKLRAEDLAPFVTGTDVVGLTAMTPTVDAAIAIARHLKRASPNLRIILGGAHATLLPDETLTGVPEIDVVVRGEAEASVVELLGAWEQGQPLSNVPGISYREDGKVIGNPASTANIDLDSLPFLAYHLLPGRRYRPHPPHGRAFPFAAIITSRGCPYHCSYCSKPVFGSKFRAQSPERVVEEVAYHMDRFGVKEFAFYDDVFTLDKKRAHAIADEIIKRGLRMAWTCETRVNLVDEDLLSHMKKAGCYAVAYGIESSSPQILDTLNKGISPEQIEEAVHQTREAGVQATGYFMIGSPGESPETIRETIEFAKKLRLDFAQFAVTTPFPGTELNRLYQQDTGNAIPWGNFVYAGADKGATPVFESDQLSRADLLCWARRAHKEFYLRPSYLWQRLRQVNSIQDFKTNVEGFFMLMENMNLTRERKA